MKKTLLVTVVLIICSTLVACNNVNNNGSKISNKEHEDKYTSIEVEYVDEKTTEQIPDGYVDISIDLDKKEDFSTGLKQDVEAHKSDFRSDKELDSSSNDYSELDFSMFSTEESVNVMKQLLNECKAESFEVIKIYDTYSADIETRMYYITMDYKNVYYIYEQYDNAYALHDDYFSYDEVIKLIEEEESREREEESITYAENNTEEEGTLE